MNPLSEIKRVLTLEGQSLLDCADRLSDEKTATGIQSALELIQRSLTSGGKIIVVGIGKSGKVAQKVAATFCSTGSLAVYLHPSEGLHGDLGVVQSKDVVLAFSYTGNTEEIVKLIPSLKSLRVALIAVCGNRQSKLAESSDAFIDASVAQEACPLSLAPTSSTTLALALGDALAVALMQWKGFDEKSFAQNHPGGALGNRLNLRVADLMHKGEALAICGPKTSMDEVVVLCTQKRLGAVLVTEKEKLLGVITDGDIRKALQYREKFFILKAEEVMTRKPVTVSPNALAREALGLMENRPQQISVLPVVDEKGYWKGLIRIHDIVREI